MLIHHKPSSPRKGEVLSGRYCLIEEIGRGRFGSVHRALDNKSGSELAVKVGPERNPEFAVKVLGNEGMALRKADHPCVVRFLDEGFSGAGPYLAMEYVNGQNLKQFLRGRNLGTGAALGIMRDVCSALESIHAAGVVHRDLKPKNVMVGLEGAVKIIDFGFSYVRGREDTTSGFSARFGSPIYSPPEDTRGNGDPRADIYSAGVMLYEMLMKKMNFYMIDALKLIELRFWRGIRQSSESRVSGKALEIIMCATERNPERRFRDAGQMRQAIESSLVEPL